MINSVIESLKRSCRVLDAIPQNIEEQKQNILSELNDVFEDFRDTLDAKNDADTIKKVVVLKKDVLSKVDEFCIAICAEVKEDIDIVEE
jgi:AAA+ ATPase superfamily predicted ATPase